MTRFIRGRHPWRVFALSLALVLSVAANVASYVASSAHAADSRECGASVPHAASSTHAYSLYPLIPGDKYIDSRTGISLPDSPMLSR